jgi:murein DD-endopeptidase MepM/ murein hydrolase activator NlpD
MRYYDSLGDAGYPISRPCTTMACSYDEHLARGSHGVDYAVKTGTPVIAPAKGRTRNFSNASAGNAVELRHLDANGNVTGFVDTFMHLKDGGFVAEGVYNAGDTIGFSGNTGFSTGPHIHWVAKLDGRFVRQWEYFYEEPITSQGVDMYYNVVAATGWQYVVGAEYVRVITGAEVPHVAHNMGAPKSHATLNDFVLWCKALNIPEDKVRALSTTNRTWSKIDTISGGGGATPAEIAAAVDASLKDDFAAIPKTVNDDVAKRMSS